MRTQTRVAFPLFPRQCVAATMKMITSQIVRQILPWKWVENGWEMFGKWVRVTISSLCTRTLSLLV